MPRARLRHQVACAGCSNSFECFPHDLGKVKYCSRTCYFSRLQSVGRPRRIVTATCEHCRETFQYRGSRYRNRRFCSVPCKAQWQASLPFDQWRGKLSANRDGRARGDRNGMWGRAPSHGKWIIYRGVKFRSSWEHAVAAYLDKLCVPWEYEARRFRLADRTYLPDFWLPSLGIFWEVKGWLHARHAETIRQFRELSGYRLVVIGIGSIRGIAASAGVQVAL